MLQLAFNCARSIDAHLLTTPHHPFHSAGTSSFGMSGVNAHALFVAPATLVGPSAPAPPLRRARHWALPRPHQLLGGARSGAGGRTTFSCRLCRSELSYLWQHQV